MKTPSTQVLRQPKIAIKKRSEILKIFREALVCQIGIIDGGHPVVIPMVFVLVKNHLYLHGSTESRLMLNLAAGKPACVSVTILDALVLARSAFNHSMNYRSGLLFGAATKVTKPAEKLAALRALSERYIPERWVHLRKPNKEEMDQTLVVKFDTKKLSGKARAGGPSDFEKDLDHPVWAGEIPLSLTYGFPRPDPRLKNTELPEHLKLFYRAHLSKI